MLLLQGGCCRVHLCVCLQRKARLINNNQLFNIRVSPQTRHNEVTDNVSTFCTWLISSCLRFWFRVIFLSGCSPKSVTPPISVLFLTASFTVLVSARRAFPTHSSRRLLTACQRKGDEHHCKAVGEGLERVWAN